MPRPNSIGKPSPAAKQVQTLGKVRIVGGAWRRLQLPVAAVPGLRPTPDRVRETLFNCLGQTCTGWRVLDVFAGTGALGLEAASRGAVQVDLLENHTLAIAQLRQNLAYLLPRWPVGLGPAPTVQVHAGDACQSLRRLAARPVAQGAVQAPLQGVLPGTQYDFMRYHFIALDPPFHTPLLAASLPWVPKMLAPGGRVYVEWHEPLFGTNFCTNGAVAPALSQLLPGHAVQPLRHVRAGQVHGHLFTLACL